VSFFILAFYTVAVPHLFFVARATALALLMLWFATHHVAPTLSLAGHSHQVSQDQILQWKAAHAHVQHCEFCSAAGYLGVWMANSLPRAPQQLTRGVLLLAAEVASIQNSTQARAPPKVL
jgi:hypothetical protein